MSFVRIILLCISFLWGKQYSVCQEIFSREILSSAEPMFINGNIRYTKSLRLLDYDSVRKLDNTLFVPFEKKQPVIFHGYDPYYYSFRFIINNTDSKNSELILVTGGLGIKHATLWRSDGKKLGVSGYQYPFEKRAYPFVHHSFKMELRQNKTDTFFLLADENHAYKTFSFVVAHPDALAKKAHTLYIFIGFMMGVILLFAVINFSLYASIKEKIHLWYGLYLVSIAIFAIKHEGIDAEFFGTDFEMAFRLSPMGGFSALAIGLLTYVIQLFLKEQIVGTIIERIFILLKWSNFIGALLYFITFSIKPAYEFEAFVVEWTTKTILLSSVVILLSGFYYSYKGYRPALFIVFGMSVFLLGSITRVLFIGTKNLIFPPNLFQVGLLVEVIIISFGIMWRYNLYKKEKETLKEKLESYQLKASQDILATQEEEQKRIARDLHDELGGNLAAIKMTLNSLELSTTNTDLLMKMIDKTSESARTIAHNLMPPEFENTSLSDILRTYFNRINSENSLKINFNSVGNQTLLSKQQELMVYRIVLELTSNIMKHSMATEATFQLFNFDSQLEIMVEDNGIGYPKNYSEGMGLKNIRNRVNYLGGKLTIDSEKRGTTIIVQIPLNESNE